MQKLGTILPTANTYRINSRFAKQQEIMKERVAASSCLKHCERRVVGGEVRYYDTTDQYAIVSRQGDILWFQVTPNGDYRIKIN